MKKILLLLVFAFTVQLGAKADEGMWLLTLLNKNYEDMKKQGFKLTPEDIYSLNHASLKDAIGRIGQGQRGFCTAELVSSKGLLLTNHHCGYGAIQAHSSVEDNILRDGFWAKTYADEKKNPGYFIDLLVKLEDVTALVTKKVKPDMSEKERAEAIDKAAEKLIKKATKGTKYFARVKAYFSGNQYFMLTYVKYRDLRLVGNPPESVGKYGHDTDNWMWPRHTGDYSVFRVYADKNNEPADVSDDNVPYSPKRYLKVSTKGYKKGDFTMIMGYPGGTDRYLTSYGVEELLDITHPNRVKIRGVRQDVIMEDMVANEKIRIQYSSKYARSSNYWKYSIGQSKGLKKLNVKAKKEATQARFVSWLGKNADAAAKYGDALKLIEKAYASRKSAMHASQYLSETTLRGIELIGFANKLNATEDTESATKAIKAFFKDYSMPTDKKVAVEMLKLICHDVPKADQPDFLNQLRGEYNKDVNKFVDDMFNTFLASEEKALEWAKTMDKAKLESQLVVKAAISASAKSKELYDTVKSVSENLHKGERLYLAGLMEMDPQLVRYPDANFTMRLTYGTVGDYSPQDAVRYSHVTTIDGVMEKYVPGDFEFDLPEKFIKLYEAKDFGPYVDKETGKLIVCFTSNNDITGGNSGSPIMDGEGNLIGLAFDGNWEAMSGDIAFETELQKTINVDIRYVLWTMDKLGGAKHIVDEMTIVSE